MNSDFLHRVILLIEEKMGMKHHSIRLPIWEDVIKERMTLLNFSTYQDYFQYLQTSPAEIQELVEKIVIPETWFFRDKEVFQFLSLWLKQANSSTVLFKILSLACSTGEEPYSIAMTFFEAGLSRNTFSIDAIDISKEALVKAQAGMYQKKSFRNQDLSHLNHYFDATEKGYAIKQQVKDRVHFYYGNILDDKTFLYPHFYHLIFCRNLLIYLNRNSQKIVLERIKKLLSPQGILVVGSAEAQIASGAGFIPLDFPHTYAFKLRSEPQAFSKRNKTVFYSQPKAKKTSRLLTQVESIPLMNSSLQLSSSEECKAALIQEATKLADAGLFEESMQMCSKFIDQYGANAEIYYLQGLINQASQNEDQAENFFQKAVYLKPSHYEALVCLALLYERKGNSQKAELFRQRARKNL